MENILAYIDSNKDSFINRLRENVEIASVSGWPTHRDKCIEQMEIAKTLLEKFAFSVERYYFAIW